VATFEGDSITAEELHDRFMEMSPYAREHYQTLDQRKEYIEGIARFELLAAEAVRRGLHKDPDVMENAKKVMVQKLLQKENEERSAAITDADLSDYYQKHLQDYVKPEMTRLSHVFLAAASPADRTRRKPEAEQLLHKAKALHPMDFAAFGKIARESSEEPRTKPLDGDMRYLSTEELKTQYGVQVVETAATLKQAGALSGVVETDRGLHILKLQGRESALNLGIEQVKQQLQSRIAYERRTQSYEQLIDSLKKKASYQVLDESLAKLKFDLKAPIQPPKGSAARGFMPPSPNSSRPTVPPP
jgi:peptidyl-prolyl cis-trans isomerase C